MVGVRGKRSVLATHWRACVRSRSRRRLLESIELISAEGGFDELLSLRETQEQFAVHCAFDATDPQRCQRVPSMACA